MKAQIALNDLRKKCYQLIVITSSLLFAASSLSGQSVKPVIQKKSAGIKVYTTALNTSDRLTRGNDLQFTDAGNLVERKVFVFVDDSHTFQTMLGIGGAITDASAETFAKLSPDQQNELLKAYYDPKDGIGYTLA